MDGWRTPANQRSRVPRERQEQGSFRDTTESEYPRNKQPEFRLGLARRDGVKRKYYLGSCRATHKERDPSEVGSREETTGDDTRERHVDIFIKKRVWIQVDTAGGTVL